MSTQPDNQSTAAPAIDEFPADRSLLASMTPEERSAIYLNQIRKSMQFFVVLALIGIVLAVVLSQVHH